MTGTQLELYEMIERKVRQERFGKGFNRIKKLKNSVEAVSGDQGRNKTCTTKLVRLVYFKRWVSPT